MDMLSVNEVQNDAEFSSCCRGSSIIFVDNREVCQRLAIESSFSVIRGRMETTVSEVSTGKLVLKHDKLLFYGQSELKVGWSSS